MSSKPDLRRMRHESDDQYEDRYNVFVELRQRYGEEAETLSMVYSNMKYMHCRYPPGVEAKLAHIACKYLMWVHHACLAATGSVS